MDIVGLLNSLLASINELQSKLADAQAAADSIAKENYDRGFADGVASVPPVPNDETPFSQADLDNAVNSAVMPLNEKIAQLEARIVELESRPTGPSPEEIEAIKNEAMAQVKADIKSKLDEFEANNL